MVIKNPCRSCLVKPCCMIECDNIEKFKKVQETVGILGLISGILFSITILASYWFMPDTISSDYRSLIIISFWILMFIIAKVTITYQDTPNEMLTIEDYTVIFVFAPSIFIAVIIVGLFELYAKPNDSDRLLL